VERRLEHRLSTGAGLAAGLPKLDVRVTNLAKPAQNGLGRLIDISESGMGVAVAFPLSAGDIVQIDVEDSRLFGFVAHSRPEEDEYRVGIELQRVLIGGSDCSRLLHLALRRTLPELPGVVTANFSL
jgi:hypothetical protein